MPNILDLLRNPLQDAQGQPDYPATAVDLNAQSLPAPMTVGPLPTPPPTPQNAIVGQPGASQGQPAAAPIPDAASLVKQAIVKKYGYSQAADEGALQDAMQMGNTNKLYANMGGALNTITNAISGRQQPADNSFFDKLGSQADDQVKNVLTLRKGEQEDQAFSRQQELQDPNGVKAAILRKQMTPMLAKLGMNPSSLNGLSVQDLKDFATQPMEFAAKMRSSDQQHADATDMKKLMMQQSLTEKNAKHETDAQTQLEHNKDYQGQQKLIDTADSMIQKIELAKHNPQAANALATEMSLYLSEGQRMHSQTIDAMAGGSKAFLPKLLQGGETRWNGTLTEENAEAAKNLVRAIAAGAAQSKGTIEKRAADNYAKIHGKAPSWASGGDLVADEMRKRGLLK